MKFVVKFFSDITIKSRPVRKRPVAKLHSNLNAVLREYDPEVQIKHGWDKLQSKGDTLDSAKTYMLYCGKGVMSRLHASHLVKSRRLNVKVYAP